MPLAVVGVLANARIGGELNGTIALQRTGALPQIAANVEVGGTSIAGTPVGTGHLSMRSDGERVSAGVRFEKGSGNLQATARAALVWDGLIPRVDTSRPVVLGLTAKQFDAIVLQPLLSDVLSELSGDVDVNLTATLQPRAPSDKIADGESAWTADIEGNAVMRSGLVQLAALGLELDDVAFRASAASHRRHPYPGPDRRCHGTRTLRQAERGRERHARARGPARGEG